MITLPNRLQTNRYELKYVIDERRARAMRDYVRVYMEPDAHVRDLSACSYPVHSLYLDTPAFDLYRQTIDGLKNRFKLRIRFYDNSPSSPAFLEIKRRLTDVIRKERAAVSKECVYHLMNGSPSCRAERNSAHCSDGERAALERFCHLREKVGAGGAAYVSYDREAYVSPGSDNLRVTFDRQLTGNSFCPPIALTPPSQGVAACGSGVILEIKFVDRFPRWLQDVVLTLDLQRCSFAKYCRCVEALRRHRFSWSHTLWGQL